MTQIQLQNWLLTHAYGQQVLNRTKQQLQHLVLPQESPLHIEDVALRAYLQLDSQ